MFVWLQCIVNCFQEWEPNKSYEMWIHETVATSQNRRDISLDKRKSKINKYITLKNILTVTIVKIICKIQQVFFYCMSNRPDLPTQIAVWCNGCKVSRHSQSIKTKGHSVRPTNEIVIDEVRIQMMQDSRITTKQLAYEVNISTVYIHFNWA